MLTRNYICLLEIFRSPKTNYAKTAQFVPQVSAAHGIWQAKPNPLVNPPRKPAHSNRQNSSASPSKSEDSCRPGESITVRVICPSSRVLIFRTDVNKRLNELKSEVILELSDDPDSIQLFAPDVRHLNPRYRLYRAEYHGGELNEAETLAQLKVRNNESFILAPRRSTLPHTVVRIREVPGPNEQLVESATRYVPSNASQLPTIDINEIFQQSNVSSSSLMSSRVQV